MGVIVEVLVEGEFFLVNLLGILENLVLMLGFYLIFFKGLLELFFFYCG